MSIVSIIVRTLNEARHLGQLLRAIEQQQLDGLEPEVIVVDSGSTDRTLEIAERHGCRIITIGRHEFSFGRSLNIGCEAAAGDYLVFISGHCIPVDHRWLQELCNPLLDGQVAYCYGRQVGGRETKFSEKRIFAKYFPDETKIPQAGYYCNNANAALLRSVWHSRPFDEELTGLEDMHLAKRLVDEGLQVGYVSTASVYHLHDETWQQVRRRFEREAMALRRIMPQVHVRQRDVVRYVCTSIVVDAREAWAEGVLMESLTDIVKYRFHQYIGSYLGNRLHQELSHSEKERYFYPADPASRLRRKSCVRLETATSGNARRTGEPRQ